MTASKSGRHRQTRERLEQAWFGEEELLRDYVGMLTDWGSCSLLSTQTQTPSSSYFIELQFVQSPPEGRTNQTKRTATHLGRFHLCPYYKISRYQQNTVWWLEKCLRIAAVWHTTSVYRTPTWSPL